MTGEVWGDDAVRALTESLVKSAAALMACRTEHEALELAGDALHARGFAVSVLLRDGDQLCHTVLRHHPVALQAAERLYGIPMSEVRLELASFPQAIPVFVEARAVFQPDVFAVMDKVHTPEVAAIVRKMFPHSTAVDAPIPVGGQVHGMLSVFADTLSPAAAAVLELFGRLLGAALDNVRHHQQQDEQFKRLQRLQDDLLSQERLAVLGEAAAVLAHEVRNPLGVILNGMAILRLDTAIQSDRSKLAISLVEEELARLDALVHDVLRASRPMQVRLAECELCGLVRSHAPEVWKSLDAGSAELILELPAGEAIVSADEPLLQLALEKLLRNAAQASPPGGRVRVIVERSGDEWVLAVEDEGPGVPDADSARIFRPFFTTRTAGAGLGLTVVQRVAGAHQARLEARSRDRSGLRVELGFRAAAMSEKGT